ncbi:MAG: PilZ domain-containing protein [Myxococcaceae bacterium]
MERRTHARVAVPLDARVILNEHEVAFTVRELSRSGIFLYTTKPPGKVGDNLTLKLAITAGIKPVCLVAQIVRIATESGGEILGMGLRFVKGSPEQDKAVLDLMDRALLGRGTQMRSFPRVSYLLSVRCTSREQLEVMLRDIGEGGVGLETNSAFEKDETITLEVSRAGNPTGALKLKGWVVSCLPAVGRPGKYRIGVCFTALSSSLRKELVDFLRKLYRR